MNAEVLSLREKIASLPPWCPLCLAELRLRYRESVVECCVECMVCEMPFAFWSIDYFTADQWQDVYRIVGTMPTVVEI